MPIASTIKPSDVVKQAVKLLDTQDVPERASEIMRKEPLFPKTGLGCLASNSFWCGSRNNVAFSFCKTGHAVHGTNLAVAVSALRNTDATLVPVAKLGQMRATGATPENYLRGGPENVLREVVFAADLQNFGGAAMESAESYAKGEAGLEPKIEGTRTLRRSEASLIPVLLVGDLSDPRGKGAELNKYFQNPTEEAAKTMNKTVEEVKELFSTQIIGESFKIRAIFASHPMNAEQDVTVRKLVEELVRLAGAERGCDYSREIRVGLLRKEIAEFKEANPGKYQVDKKHLDQLLL